MPIFSLPSKYGIGDFGEESYKFVDYLESANQKIWQILPLVQTGSGNSPYSSVCSNSFNPYYISLSALKDEGVLTERELEFATSQVKMVDYGKLYRVRDLLLRKAFYRYDKTSLEYVKFKNGKEFYDYALFMAIKEHSGYKPFYEWEKEYKYRNKKALKAFALSHSEEIEFRRFLQFIAKKQWLNLKKYANKKGVKIMGDMPLYVSQDSVDVWLNPNLFKLDKDLNPTKVAGVPPDYFSQSGQLWGNPLYDYDNNKEGCIRWWVSRITNTLKIYDYVRIDHFRALDRYYEIPFGAKDATQGVWVSAPGRELFDRVFEKVKRDKIVAEDLGIIDDGVRDLLRYANLPGMKILSFAFNGDPDNLYLPENAVENGVCYTGTHDNDTLMGLWDNSNDWDRANLLMGVNRSLKKMNINRQVSDKASFVKAVIELGYKSKSQAFIVPIQDVFGLSSEYRINVPGTISEKNWSVRIAKKHFKKSYADALKKLTIKYGR